MKYTGFQFHQPIKDLDGQVINRQVPLTKEEIEAAQKQGKESIAIPEVPLTVQFAIKSCLTADLKVYGPQGTVSSPDPHEDKKYELFELCRKVMSIGNNDETIELTSEEQQIIVSRAKKRFGVEIFGFLYEVVEGKNTHLKTVNSGESVQAN